MKKVCKKCLIEKNITDFYRHIGMNDGHLNFCKLCVKNRIHHRYVKNIDVMRQKERIRSKKRQKDPLYRKYKREQNRKYYQKTKLPHNILRQLKKTIPSTCELCGIPKEEISFTLHAHHNNYREPFKVIWVCPPCHSKIHRKKKGKKEKRNESIWQGS